MAETDEGEVSAERRALMQRIKQRDTVPEIAVRRALHAMGLRFRLQRRDLPGTPDIVLPSRRLVIFVHGCFWHRHQRCAKATTPKTRGAFWAEKFAANIARDRRNTRDLARLGWRGKVVWECETKDAARLEAALERALLAPHELSRRGH